MSQFAGYVLPGTVFVAFGLKWTLDASTGTVGKLLEDEASSGTTKKTGSGRCKCRCWRRLPMEGIVKLSVTGIGIIASVIAAYPGGLNQELQHVGDILYATVYLFYAISGLVDVLTFYCPHALPYGLNHFSLALAFVIEGLMFALHLRHQAFMEQHVHLLLVCAIFSCAFVSLTEIVLPYSLLIKFSRALTSLVHGSWYIQSGFILYNPTRAIAFQWNTSKDFNDALVWISLSFAWHTAGAFILLLIIIMISKRRKPIPLPPQPEHIETYERCYQHAPSSPAPPSELLQGIQPCNFCSSHTLSACTVGI